MFRLSSKLPAFIVSVALCIFLCAGAKASTTLPISPTGTVAAACGFAPPPPGSPEYIKLERKWEEVFGNAAVQTELIDRFVEQAENITVPASKKSPTFEKWRKIGRGALDRAVWGGALLLLGLLLTRYGNTIAASPAAARFFTCTGMISFGCAYALLLPFLAVLALLLAAAYLANHWKPSLKNIRGSLF